MKGTVNCFLTDLIYQPSLKITKDLHSVRVQCTKYTLICSALIDCAVYVQALKINEFVGLKFCEEAVIQNNNMSAAVTNCSVSTVGLTWVNLYAVCALLVFCFHETDYWTKNHFSGFHVHNHLHNFRKLYKHSWTTK